MSGIMLSPGCPCCTVTRRPKFFWCSTNLGNLPLTDLTVKFIDEENNILEAITDSSGELTIELDPDTIYTIEASHEIYGDFPGYIHGGITKTSFNSNDFSSFGTNIIMANPENWICCPGKRFKTSRNLRASVTFTGDYTSLAGLPYNTCYEIHNYFEYEVDFGDRIEVVQTQKTDEDFFLCPQGQTFDVPMTWDAVNKIYVSDLFLYIDRNYEHVQKDSTYVPEFIPLNLVQKTITNIKNYGRVVYNCSGQVLLLLNAMTEYYNSFQIDSNSANITHNCYDGPLVGGIFGNPQLKPIGTCTGLTGLPFGISNNHNVIVGSTGEEDPILDKNGSVFIDIISESSDPNYYDPSNIGNFALAPLGPTNVRVYEQ